MSIRVELSDDALKDLRNTEGMRAALMEAAQKALAQHGGSSSDYIISEHSRPSGTAVNIVAATDKIAYHEINKGGPLTDIIANGATGD